AALVVATALWVVGAAGPAGVARAAGASPVSGAGASHVSPMPAGAASHKARGTAIWRENQTPGNWRWQDVAAPNGAIEGYASQVSVIAGQTVDLHVGTIPAHEYRVEVYRLGWYGGTGARLIACEPSCPPQRKARTGRGHPARPRPIHRGRPEPVPAPDRTTGE